MGNYPLYCNMTAAMAASPVNTSHAMGSAYMPNEYDGNIMDGSYAGDAPECHCGEDTEMDDHSGHDDTEMDDHSDHDHSHTEAPTPYEESGALERNSFKMSA